MIDSVFVKRRSESVHSFRVIPFLKIVAVFYDFEVWRICQFFNPIFFQKQESVYREMYIVNCIVLISIEYVSILGVDL